MAESHSIIQPKHPKRNNIQITCFYFIFHYKSISHPLQLFLLLVFTTYFKGPLANLKVRYRRCNDILIHSQLIKEESFTDVPDICFALSQNMNEIRIIQIDLVYLS